MLPALGFAQKSLLFSLTGAISSNGAFPGDVLTGAAARVGRSREGTV